INKSTTDETALIEIDNFEPGMQYYYHTLTGGDDNGDFSRKVFLNGYGTDEEGGGPDDYETVKAFAAEVEGGIKVDLPALSVVYLMVDKKPPLSYVSSKIDTNSTVISVELSEPVLLSENPAGFEVIANGSAPLTITGLEVDSENASLIYILLDQEVVPTDIITLSYSGTDVMSLDSIPLAPFSEVLVDNLLPGAIPRLTDAFTTTDGTLIHLIFNMGMQISGSAVESFVLVAGNEPDQIIEISDINVDEEDSTKIVITPADPLFAEYELFISYSGTGVISIDNALLEPFDSLRVTNHAPGLPPELLSAEVSDYGFSIIALFSKQMNNLSEYGTLFTIKVNDEIYAIDTIQFTASSMTISLADYIQFAEVVTLSYEGTEVTSVDRGQLQPIENFPIDNMLIEPVVFEIPGMIDAELFTINRGMVLEPCSDSGGGNNLGYIDPGDWLEFEVNVSETGYYNGNLRIAAANQSGLLVIQTPDGEILNQDTVTTLVTGGWQEWTSVPSEIILHEGRQRLRLIALTSNFNLNWLDLEFNKTLQANFISATTNETGDTIEIVFDKELGEPEEGEQTGFTVQADGNSISVTRLGLNNDLKTTLLLALNTQLPADSKNITVSYESGTLMAADQTPVAFFTDMQVTNHVITDIGSMKVPGFSFYPHPANNRITVESSELSLTSVEVVD
ncbi:MAG: carbohydrate-binding protein, partial [Bacteroidales bacterium]|nr:carbohydrate-binding protein [Bacteroidales bacterium]